MRLVNGDPASRTATSKKKNGVRPWFAIDLGTSSACKIFKIRVRGPVPSKTGNVNVRQ